MVIQWYGHACFKIQSGDLVVAIEPHAKEGGLTPPRFRADVAMATHGHYDHANLEAIAGEPFLIQGPGEYEVKGVYIHGIPTYHDQSQGRERGMNTVYMIEVEGIRLLHLGDFGEEKLREETLEEIGEVHVLLTPVGGVYTIDGEGAARVAKQIEPRFVIPMHYKIPGLTITIEGPDAFLKAMAAGKPEPQDKLTIKKKDVEAEGKTEVVVLKPANA